VDLYVGPYPEYQRPKTECRPQPRPNYCFRFFDEGGLESDTMPIIYEWDFGDGTKQEGLEVRHCYEKPGRYQVQLNLIDTISGNWFMTQAAYDLEVRRPEGVYMTVPDTVVRGVPVRIHANDAVLEDCALESYQWKIGAEFSTSGRTFSYIFEELGPQEIELNVSGGSGAAPRTCKACVTKTVMVVAPSRDPIVRDSLARVWSAEAAPPVEEVECTEVEAESFCYTFFDEAGVPSDTFPFIYQWDLGDGTKKRGETVQHCYDYPGVYTVRLNIVDPQLNQSLYTQAEYELDVTHKSAVGISAFETVGVGEELRMDAYEVGSPACDVQRVFWDFDDGETKSGAEVAHAWERPGTYRVRMVFSGRVPGASAKCEECFFQEITVLPNFSAMAQRDSVQQTNEVPDSELKEGEELTLEISKPGYKTAVVRFPPGDSGKTKTTVEMEREEGAVVVSGRVKAKDQVQNLEDVEVRIVDLETGNLVRRMEVDAGEFSLSLETGKKYEVIARRDGYLSQKKVIGPLKAGENVLEALRMELVPIELGVPTVLENIYYDYDKSHIRHSAAIELKKLSLFLLANPSISIELSSHTDARGGDAYNLVLSQQRAQAAVDFLVALGVERSRIVARGYGEQRLANNCMNDVDCDEARHQQNRRTAFAIQDYRETGYRRAQPVEDAPEEAPDETTPTDLATLRKALYPRNPARQVDGSLFSIQLGLLSHAPTAAWNARLGPYADLLVEEAAGDLRLFRVGALGDYAVASEHLRALRALGFDEAAIINIQPATATSPTTTTSSGSASPSAKFYYTIQIGVHGRSTPEAFFRPLGEDRQAVEEKRFGAIRKISVFRLPTYAQARKSLARIRRLGYHDAFIVAYRNGKRLSIDKARALERR
ncbi:MAG: PKD domain-containing protein, partial [Bacteroidota bacterium]